MKVATAAALCAACFSCCELVMISFLGLSRLRLWIRCLAEGICIAELQAPRGLPSQKRVI